MVDFITDINFLHTSGLVEGTSELLFKDQHLASGIPLSELNVDTLSPNYDATSIVGVINELKDKDGTVNTLEGLSGTIDLDSPDESVNIVTNGQVVEITTPGSGAPSGAAYILTEYNDNDHLIQARVLSATSGIRLNDKGARSGSGIAITLDFDNEPASTEVLSWNGNKLEWVANAGGGGGVDSIEGLAGVVDLDSPDESVNVQVNGQTIELTTPGSGHAPSGASYILIDYDDNDHLVKARRLSATSGIILDDQGARSVSGMVVKLDFEQEPVTGEVLSWNGSRLEWIPDDTGVTTLEGLAGVVDLDSPDGTVLISLNGQTIELIVLPDAGQTSVEGLSGVVDLDSPDGTVLIDVNGQAIELTVLPDAGQTSVEGLSGTIDLDSPDESLNIVTNGQTIEITTPTSGAPSGASYILVDYNDNGHLVDARQLSATSGIILDDQGARSGSGIVIKLDFDDEPAVGEILTWEGTKLEWTTGAGAGVDSIEGLAGTVDLDSPDESINIQVNGQIIELTTPGSGHAPSGASYILVDYNDNDHLTDARRLTATSGVRIVDDGARSNSGIALMLDFDDEPSVGELLTWEGTKLEWTAGAAAGVDSIEGVAGTVDLDSPDQSVNIQVNGQIIELTTPGSGHAPSGASYILIDYNDNDHLVDARVLSATSGIILDDQGARSVSGIVIKLDFEEEPAVGEVLSWNGSRLSWTVDDTGVTTLEGLAGVVNLDSPDGTVLINVDGQNIELIVLPDEGQTSVEGLSGLIDLDSPDGTVLIGVNGQAIELTVLPDTGQTSVEGLSGVIDIDSPDESVNINVNGQIIELTTPGSGHAPSGASYILVDYNDNDHLTDARRFSATSGIILDDQGARSVSGIVVKLDFEQEPAVGEVLSWNGSRLEWIPDDTGVTTLEGLAGIVDLDSPDGTVVISLNGQAIELIVLPDAGQTSVEGLSGVIDLDSPDGTVLIDVNGQAVELTVLPDAGQTSVEGLSGVIDLDSPDESVNINVNSQAIELTAPSGYAPSGASFILVDYNDNDHLTDARRLSATSGIILDEQGARSASGIVVKLDFENEPAVGQVLSWDGTRLEWVANTGGGGVTSIEGLGGVVDLDSPDGTVLIDVNGQAIELIVLPDAGQTSVEGLSGVIDVSSPDGTVLIDVNGQAIELTVLPDTGQMSVEGLSGLVDLDSPDESINIVVNAQAIELTAPSGYAPSGASFILVDYNDNDHLVDARRLTATSGIILDDQGARSASGIVVKLDFEEEPAVGEVLSWNGSRLGWIPDDTGVTTLETLAGVVDLDSPDGTVIIGVNGQAIELTALPDAGQTSVEGLSGVVDVSSPDGTVIIDVNGQAIELTVLPDAGQTSVEGLSGVIDLSSPDSTIGITVNAQAIELIALPIESKSITVESPTGAEDIALFHADAAYTITQMTVVLVGSASQTVTWTVRKSSDRSAAGTEVVTGGTVTTDITTGDDVTTFNSDTIAADDFVWLETTAQGGTVTQFHLTIHMIQT